MDAFGRAWGGGLPFGVHPTTGIHAGLDCVGIQWEECDFRCVASLTMAQIMEGTDGTTLVWFRWHGLLWEGVTCPAPFHPQPQPECELIISRSQSHNADFPKYVWGCPNSVCRKQYPMYGPYMTTRGQISPMALLAIWMAHARGEADVSASELSKPTVRNIRKKVNEVVTHCGMQHLHDAVVIKAEANVTQPTMDEWRRRRTRLGRAPHDRARYVTFLATMAAAGRPDDTRRVQILLASLRLYAQTCVIAL